MEEGSQECPILEEDMFFPQPVKVEDEPPIEGGIWMQVLNPDDAWQVPDNTLHLYFYNSSCKKHP